MLDRDKKLQVKKKILKKDKSQDLDLKKSIIIEKVDNVKKKGRSIHPGNEEDKKKVLKKENSTLLGNEEGKKKVLKKDKSQGVDLIENEEGKKRVLKKNKNEEGKKKVLKKDKSQESNLKKPTLTEKVDNVKKEVLNKGKSQGVDLKKLPLIEKKKLKKKALKKNRIKDEEEKGVYGKKVHFLVGRFVNHLMISGKKESAEKLFADTLFYIQKKENLDGLLIFVKALVNTKPTIDLRSVRRGGASYQIPVPLKEKRSLSMSIKWLIEGARKKGDNLALNLCNSLVEASKSRGDAVKKRESLHLTALKNRSLTHFRWF